MLGLFVDFTIPLSRTGVFLVREMVNLLPGNNMNPLTTTFLADPDTLAAGPNIKQTQS